MEGAEADVPRKESSNNSTQMAEGHCTRAVGRRAPNQKTGPEPLDLDRIALSPEVRLKASGLPERPRHRSQRAMARRFLAGRPPGGGRGGGRGGGFEEGGHVVADVGLTVRGEEEGGEAGGWFFGSLSVAGAGNGRQQQDKQSQDRAQSQQMQIEAAPTGLHDDTVGVEVEGD